MAAESGRERPAVARAFIDVSPATVESPRRASGLGRPVFASGRRLGGLGTHGVPAFRVYRILSAHRAGTVHILRVSNGARGLSGPRSDAPGGDLLGPGEEPLVGPYTPAP